mmetsp:Transcript_10902/g.19981  ORF Transcript_10902/g.19981 Transcript_10902/m.19981 type:complete len:613 (-) Transcript_10902:120-1958(-)
MMDTKVGAIIPETNGADVTPRIKHVVNGNAKKNGKTELHHTNSSSSSSHIVQSSSKDSVLTTNSGFVVKKSELVRLMVQSIRALGCNKTASMLEEESGVSLEQSCVRQFRDGILNGEWKMVRELLPGMNVMPNNMKKAHLLIFEEEFLEELEAGHVSKALGILRMSIAPNHYEKSRVDQLSSLIMYPSVEDMMRAANWRGVQGGSREKLLADLQLLMDPSFVVPSSRLLTLMEQALKHQISSCQFHNTKMKSFSLLHDHVCSLGEIPSMCLDVLDEHKDEVWFVRFSHDGKLFASASKDKSIIIWDLSHSQLEGVENTKIDKPICDHVHIYTRPEIMHKLLGHNKPPSFVAWSPDDNMLLSTDNTSSFRVWDSKTGRCKVAVPQREKYDPTKPESIVSCAWHPDGKHIITGTLIEKKIVIWDLSGQKIRTWEMEHTIRDLNVTPQGKLVVVGTDYALRMYDIATRKTEKCNVKETSPVTCFSLSQDGRYALLSVANPAAIRLWDLERGAIIKHFDGIKQKRYVVQASFGGSEEIFVVSGSEDSQVYIWHRTSGDLLAVLPGHSGTVNSVAWSSMNPHLFISASDDSTIRIWGRKPKSSMRNFSESKAVYDAQ